MKMLSDMMIVHSTNTMLDKNAFFSSVLKIYRMKIKHSVIFFFKIIVQVQSYKHNFIAHTN